MSEIITAAAHVPQDARNSYAVFRGTLAGNVAKIRVYANLFYELRIDESLVAYGPCRSRKPLLYFDEYALEPTASPKLVTLKVHARKGAPEAYVSGVTDWTVRTLTAYDAASPLCVGDVGYCEYCDLDSPEWNWFRRGFPADGFEAPREGTRIPESEFLPRPIPAFHETEVRPLTLSRWNGGWLADFGRMVYGRPVISGEFDGTGTVELGYVESLDSGWAHSEGRLEMYSDKLTGSGALNWKSFWKRPCRYLYLSGALKRIDMVSVQEYGYPVVLSGSFRCSDDRLNRLWEIAERTLRICMDDIFNDCPHRDQSQWMDAFVSAKAALSLYGVTDLTRKCLVQHGVCSFKNGQLLSPSIRGKTLFSDYALVQVLFIDWYWRVTGDRSLLEELFDNTAEGFKIFFALEEPDGLLKDVDLIGRGERSGKLDFFTLGSSMLYLDNTFELCRRGKSAGLNALYYGALNAMVSICAALGKPAELYREKAEKVRANFAKVFAQEGADGCFKDSDSRFEHFFRNINFSCEFGKWTGAGAAARIAVTAPEAGEYELLAGAYAEWRLKVNGELLYENTERESWTRPAPFYDPVRLTLSLKAGENELEFECANSNLNWEFFFDLPLPLTSCAIREIEYGTGVPAGGAEWKTTSPRPWYPPFLSQSTNAYAAYTGLLPDAASLKCLLPEEYPRNYISVRVPLFCRETTDAAELKRWIMPANTPWTTFYLVSSLFRAGLSREALDTIRRAWGVMLDRGAVNTWEEWDANASLCHAWGSSPAWFMLHDILGIQYESLGEKTIVIRPDLCGLEHAEGSAALSADGRMKVCVSLRKTPAHTEVRISVPPGYRVEKDFSRLENPVEI